VYETLPLILRQENRRCLGTGLLSRIFDGTGTDKLEKDSQGGASSLALFLQI
jgi:hypothetical protein